MTRMLMATQKFIARHGACLYFVRDGSPPRYGEVVAAQVVIMDRRQDFLLSMNGIEIESQLTNRGSRKPLWACTIPNDYATLRTNSTKTIHLNTNPVNIYYV